MDLSPIHGWFWELVCVFGGRSHTSVELCCELERPRLIGSVIDVVAVMCGVRDLAMVDCTHTSRLLRFAERNNRHLSCCLMHPRRTVWLGYAPRMPLSELSVLMHRYCGGKGNEGCAPRPPEWRTSYATVAEVGRRLGYFTPSWLMVDGEPDRRTAGCSFHVVYTCKKSQKEIIINLESTQSVDLRANKANKVLKNMFDVKLKWDEVVVALSKQLKFRMLVELD